MTAPGPISLTSTKMLLDYNSDGTLRPSREIGAQAYPDGYYVDTSGSLPTTKGFIFADIVLGADTVGNQLVTGVYTNDTTHRGVSIYVAPGFNILFEITTDAGTIYSAQSTAVHAEGTHTKVLIKWDNTNVLPSGHYVDTMVLNSGITVTSEPASAWAIPRMQATVIGKWGINFSAADFLGSFRSRVLIGTDPRAPEVNHLPLFGVLGLQWPVLCCL